MASSTNTQADEVAKLVAIVGHMIKARDNDAILDKAIDQTVEIAGQSGGRNITDFLATYKMEMQQRDVIEEKQISSFKLVVAIGYQTVSGRFKPPKRHGWDLKGHFCPNICWKTHRG